jgi:hypothetical protein
MNTIFIAIKSGKFLHDCMGVYSKLESAVAAASEALNNERDSYHSFKIYEKTIESGMTSSFPCRIISKIAGIEFIDWYDCDGVLIKSTRRY